MKREYLNVDRLNQMEKELGCTFCDDGEFAEMSMDLWNYAVKTQPIEGVRFDYYPGHPEELKTLVDSVDEDWSQYFDAETPVFCAFLGDEVVSFCIVDPNAECILSRPDIKVGSIGCVGTAPAHRGRGIGLRMVDLATVILQKEGCTKGYISYTHIDHWYAKLGYETFARFSFRG